MKNTATIKKINTIGKGGKIILMIMRILVIIGIVGTLIGGIMSLVVIPMSTDKNLINLNGNADITMTMDDTAINSTLVNTVVESDNFDFDMFGIKMSLEELPLKDGISGTNFKLDLDNVEVSPVSFALVMAAICFATAILLAAFLVMIIFASKMAKALEVCNSPFEAEVIRRMKHFAYSMIPWGIIFGLASDSLLMVALVVMAVMAIIYIFSYGAELQQEADDTV